MKRFAAACCTACPRVGDHAPDLRMVEVQELEDAFGKPGRLEGFGVALGHERRLRRHLEDHAVAREERRHHRVHRSEPRIVPGRDNEHDAERLAADETPKAGFGLDLDIGEGALSRFTHMQSTFVEPALELARALADRAAHLPAELGGQFVGMLDAPLRHALADRGALGDGDLLPGFLGLDRLFHHTFDLLAGCEPAPRVHRAVDRGNRALDFHGLEYSGRRSTRRATASMTSAQVTPKGR
jgi:hypothetical protein